MFKDFSVAVDRFENAFQTIETHTVGEPTRIVISGFPPPEGKTMMERKQFLETHCDNLRSALMCEPRGHRDMVGAILMDPISPQADLGVIYMDANRWINMCGHATIGCATVAVETGMVPVESPFTMVILETPSGLVSTRVKVEGQKAVEVTFANVPSFLYAKDVCLTVDGIDIVFDIAFGGSFFALVDADQLGLDLDVKNIPMLIALASRLLQKTNQELAVRHPLLNISGVANAEFYGSPRSKQANQCNIVISAEGQVDRSPCGTGTSAKLAALFARGKLSLNENFINENFTGAKFTGVVSEETRVGPYAAIIPMVTGSAYISGVSTHLIDPNDPLKYGFNI